VAQVVGLSANPSTEKKKKEEEEEKNDSLFCPLQP
jgi:hypothetical protein